MRIHEGARQFIGRDTVIAGFNCGSQGCESLRIGALSRVCDGGDVGAVAGLSGGLASGFRGAACNPIHGLGLIGARGVVNPHVVRGLPPPS